MIKLNIEYCMYCMHNMHYSSLLKWISYFGSKRFIIIWTRTWCLIF